MAPDSPLKKTIGLSQIGQGMSRRTLLKGIVGGAAALAGGGLADPPPLVVLQPWVARNLNEGSFPGIAYPDPYPRALFNDRITLDPGSLRYL